MLLTRLPWCPQASLSRRLLSKEFVKKIRSDVKNKSTRGEQVKEVEKVRAVRIFQNMGLHSLQFLVELKNTEEIIWIPAENVSEDVRRNFSESWWKACKEGNHKEVQKFLSFGGEALTSSRDGNLRSALHFASGIGSTISVRALIESGTEIDTEDNDGYTPLHIASGYFHKEIVKNLLEAGANPELQDLSGRSALDLVEILKANTPATTVNYSRRIALEDVAKCLESFVFEEIVPLRVQNSRVNSSGTTEYFVEWPDDYESLWVPEKQIADDLILDFQEDRSSDSFVRILGSRKAIDNENEYLVQWADSYIPSWEKQ